MLSNSGRNLFDIMTDSSEAKTFRTEWKKNTNDIRRIFCRDIGLSALNMIKATVGAHKDIRLPSITWDTQQPSFCLIDFDNCTRQVHSCNVLAGIETDPRVGLMLVTVAQIALVVWELDCENARDELNLCRTYVFASA